MRSIFLPGPSISALMSVTSSGFWINVIPIWSTWVFSPNMGKEERRIRNSCGDIGHVWIILAVGPRNEGFKFTLRLLNTFWKSFVSPPESLTWPSYYPAMYFHHFRGKIWISWSQEEILRHSVEGEEFQQLKVWKAYLQEDCQSSSFAVWRGR